MPRYPIASRNAAAVLSLFAVFGTTGAVVSSLDHADAPRRQAVAVAQVAAPAARLTAAAGVTPQLDALRKLQQQQQATAAISNMMAMRHRANMSVINNIGSSNTRYEYKYTRR